MIRFAVSEDIPALKELWAISFNDPEPYVDFYFSQGFRAEDTLVDTEHHAPVAMLSLLPAAHGVARCGYIYAAATAPAYRRQGRMERLLAFAREEAANRGYRALLLCPADDALFGYYAKLGYTILLSHRVVRMPVETADTQEVYPCTPEEYARWRSDWKTLFLSSPYDLYALREAAYSGTLYLQGTGFHAAVLPRGDALFIRELLAAPEAAAYAVAALAGHTACSEVILRLPSHCGLFPEHAASSMPYAALLPLDDGYQWSEIYTNLLLTED